MRHWAAILERRIVLLDPGAADGYVRDWQPPGVPPARHWAYAIQWWLFAVTLVVTLERRLGAARAACTDERIAAGSARPQSAHRGAACALFLVPLVAAFCMYYGASWRPAQRTNHGELILPARQLPRASARTAHGPSRTGGRSSMWAPAPAMTPAQARSM
jgi:hypothetical protein